ncbi:hypothetical protein AWB76_02129 [Caballeronia temeraria]|uniref:Uncharacterized protein n=1 Tax=Caballeronia temeraria TaxID=1777137 RepID=A0A158ABP3_9BURK|nr:hypothetical protein [Caballeronia temeraria]SAK55160.1 hypothetical protein AWB76_02129 [Caballeronia temeraria]
MIGDGLSGALCVLAALAAGSSMRASRGWWQMGMTVAVAAACCASGPAGAAALVLAVIAGFVGYRFNRGAASACTQALFVTIAFVAWALPGSDSAYAVLAGGAVAALGSVVRWRTKGRGMSLQPMHLACAGACAALAYVLGTQPGALSVMAVMAMLALIGAHLSLAMSGHAAAPVARAMSMASACGLAVAAAIDGSHGALGVAAVAIAFDCARSARLAGFVRGTP